MQQNITESVVTSIQQHSRWNTESRTPSWYREDLLPEKEVGHSVQSAKRMYIGSGEDCIVDELNVLTEEEECTS